MKKRFWGYNSYMINDIDSCLESIGISPEGIQIALFSSTNLTKDFTCVSSTMDQYKKNNKSALYKHTKLIKLLGIKSDLWTSELKTELYSEEMELITIIINWEQDQHVFCYLRILNEQVKAIIANKSQLVKDTLLGHVKEKLNE